MDTDKTPKPLAGFEAGNDSGDVDQLPVAKSRWRRERFRGEVVILTSVLGMLSTLFLGFWALQGWGYLYSPFIAAVVVAALVATVPSLELLRREARGERDFLALPYPVGRDLEKTTSASESAQRRLLETLERLGEITPARAALGARLTVEEAEHELSRLAQKGHLDVRVEDGRLVYSF